MAQWVIPPNAKSDAHPHGENHTSRHCAHTVGVSLHPSTTATSSGGSLSLTFTHSIFVLFLQLTAANLLTHRSTRPAATSVLVQSPVLAGALASALAVMAIAASIASRKL